MRLRDRTIIAGVSVIVIVLLALFLSGTVSLTVHLPTVTNQVATTATSQTSSRTSASFEISALEAQNESRWVRGANDTPEYVTTVNWSVCNDVPINANHTSVIVRSEGVGVVGYESFSLPDYACHSGKVVDLRYSYEMPVAHTVTIEAFAAGLRTSKSISISVVLPRILLEPGTVPSPELLEFAKLFITPNDPIIKEAAMKILQDRQGRCSRSPNNCADTTPIDDFLGISISLRDSGPVQLPRETLKSGTGTTIDQAILIVSLAEAAGIPSNEILVVLGTDGTTVSGWVQADSRHCETYACYSALYNWHHPHECDYLSQIGCSTSAVYYFNDQVAALA